MNEEWKAVRGFEEVYEVSNTGKVRSVDRVTSAGSNVVGKTLSPRLCGRYPAVMLSLAGVTKNHYIHRLVAEAFIENTHLKPQINHKDRIRSNNSVLNLEWCTQAENNLDVARDKSKAVLASIRGEVTRFSSLSEASRKLGVSVSGISRACNERLNNFGGSYSGIEWRFA